MRVAVRRATAMWKSLEAQLTLLAGCVMDGLFRHTHDAPLYSIAKQGRSRSVEFVVFSGREKLKRAKTLSDALKVFHKNLRVVS